MMFHVTNTFQRPYTPDNTVIFKISGISYFVLDFLATIKYQSCTDQKRLIPIIEKF